MLNFIRDNIQSSFVKFIIGVIALVFVFFGVGGFNTDSPNVLANIDGELVTLSDFQQRYRQEYARFRQSYPGKLEKWQENYIKKQVFDNLVNQALIVKIAEDKGFRVTDQELADWIYDNPSFQTDERFDVIKYEETLKRNRTTKVEFEKEIRSFIAYRKYVSFILENIPVKKEFLEEQFEDENQVYEVSAVEIPEDKLVKDVQIKDEDIKAYYEKNKQSFQDTKKFVLDYFTIDASEFDQGVIVREKELQIYYDRNKKEEFTKPEQFNSRHILVKVAEQAGAKELKAAKAKVKKIAKQLKKNKSKFASLAKKYSDDPGSKEKGGELGWVSKGTFVKEFEEALGNLKKNEISEPIKTQFGYHIIQLLNKKEESIQSFDSVKDQIKETITYKKVARIIDSKKEQLESELQEKGIIEFAQSQKSELKKSGAFNESSYVSEMPFVYSLYESIKSETTGNQGLFKTAKNDLVVYRIAQELPPAPKPLDEVRTQITLIVKNQKKEQQISEELAGLQKQIKDKKSLKKLARKYKSEIKKGDIKRSESGFLGNPSMPKTRKAIFALNKAGESTFSSENDSNYLIYLEKKYVSAEVDKEELLEQIKDSHQRLRMNVVFSRLIQQLRTEIEIDFNKDLIQSLEIPAA